MAEETREVRIPLLLTKSEAQTLDAWRYANHVPSRGEAIRRLMVLGMAAAAEKPAARDAEAAPSIRARLEAIYRAELADDPDLMLGDQGDTPESAADRDLAALSEDLGGWLDNAVAPYIWRAPEFPDAQRPRRSAALGIVEQLERTAGIDLSPYKADDRPQRKPKRKR